MKSIPSREIYNRDLFIKHKAKILKDGWWRIKSEIGPEAKNMIITDTITAVYMTHNSFTIPTAVSIESTENTKSKSTICISSF